MVDEPHRTEYAQRAYEFADVFEMKFGHLIYGVERARRLKLQEPDGPSTAGGRRARQPIVLVPDRGDGNLVVGWVDVPRHQAELRSFELLSEQFLARFSIPIDLDKEAYDRLRRDLDGFLRIQNVELRVTPPAPPTDARGGQRSAPRPASMIEAGAIPSALALVVVLVAGIAAGLGLGYALFGE